MNNYTPKFHVDKEDELSYILLEKSCLRTVQVKPPHAELTTGQKVCISRIYTLINIRSPFTALFDTSSALQLATLR